MIVDEMIKCEAITAKNHGLMDTYNPTTSRQWAQKDMSDAELAMKKFVNRLAQNIPDPDAPMIEYLFEKLKVPEQLRVNMTAELKRFTKETLQEFTSS